jgi:DNA-binding GntR family transcriptional regulator
MDDRSGRIDPTAQVYVWAQVADDLRADINAGKLPPGAKLPTELELSERYGVARNTIRRAVAELVSDGLVIVMRGRGTFVKRAGQG